MSRIPVIGITMGDPGGVGPEITLACLPRLLRERAAWVLVGELAVYEKARRSLARRLPLLDLCLIPERHDFKPHRAYLIPLGSPQARRFRPRACTALNGRLAFASLARATACARSGVFDALVTAPVSKEAIAKTQPGFLGHVEFFRRTLDRPKAIMAFASRDLVLSLATDHLPLRRVPGALARVDWRILLTSTQTFARRLLKRRVSRVALFGLNPHAGEGGLLGSEERQLSRLAGRARRWGVRIAGPMAPDTALARMKSEGLCAGVALYHDQGLGPFKALYFDEGVQVTLGLPFIRTSPDHGTAFDRAYRGAARAASMQRACWVAFELCRTGKP